MARSERTRGAGPDSHHAAAFGTPGRGLLSAVIAALAVALSGPGAAAAQAPDCVPAGQGIPEPTRDGYSLGPILPPPECPPAAGPGGGTPLPGRGAPLGPIAATPGEVEGQDGGAPGGGEPPGESELEGGGGSPAGSGSEGPDDGEAAPGEEGEVLGTTVGDGLLGRERSSSWWSPSGSAPGDLAWTGPLTDVRGLSLVDLAVGAALLIALVTVAVAVTRPGAAPAEA